MRAAALLLALLAALSLAAPQCRCLPSAPCWSAIPWAALNASVAGRLVASSDPLAPCRANAASSTCQALLNASDDQFWLTSQPNGYLHTGLFNAWNLSTQLSSYSVLAEAEEDVSAAVAFAARHNLRLVVKSTGHDWYARSASPGSLLLWTHRLSAIAFMDAFACAGCGAPPVPAVTVGAGVQFRELYSAAQAAGRLVIGGTCDSVSVGGCWLGGCFGSFSRAFGSGAANLLELRMVLANGSAVTVNAAQLPDLFWGMRGGGLGLAGVVVSYTARTHPAPTHVTDGSATFSASSAADFYDLAQGFLLHADARLQTPAWGSGGFSAGQWSFSITSHGYNLLPSDWQAAMADMVGWVGADPQRRFTAAVSSSTWNASSWAPGQPFPWMEVHPDREISTALLASFTRYLPLSLRHTPAGLAHLARTLTDAVAAQPPAGGPTGAQGTFYFMFDKVQSGLAAEQLAQFQETSLNPILLDSSALFLVMYNVPSLPTVPEGAGLLRGLWPRLSQYLVRSPEDALWAPCSAGAGGNETAAAACFAGMRQQRVPLLQAQLEALRAGLYAALPNSISGSYIAETDFKEVDWQGSQWGAATYAQLLAVKARYDAEGLFVCHHCVGSEQWAPPDYNCRVG